MEDTRNKGEERDHQAGKQWLLKPSQTSAPSTVLLLPGAADTTRRLAGHPCDNAAAVPAPQEQRLHQAYTLGSLSDQLPAPSWPLPTCLRTGGCSAVADDASREKDGEQVLVML